MLRLASIMYHCINYVRQSFEKKKHVKALRVLALLRPVSPVAIRILLHKYEHVQANSNGISKPDKVSSAELLTQCTIRP